MRCPSSWCRWDRSLWLGPCTQAANAVGLTPWCWEVQMLCTQSHVGRWVWLREPVPLTGISVNQYECCCCSNLLKNKGKCKFIISITWSVSIISINCRWCVGMKLWSLDTIPVRLPERKFIKVFKFAGPLFVVCRYWSPPFIEQYENSGRGHLRTSTLQKGQDC